MTTSLKKLLLISITLLLGMISGGVMASPSSTVTIVSGNEYAYYNGSTTTNYDLSFVSTTYGADSTLLQSQPWWGYASEATLFANAVGTSLGPSAAYISGYGPAFAYSTVTMMGSTSVQTIYSNGSASASIGFSDNVPANFAVATVHGGGAPEIDGSLAPKVGFLLGCLFLMFGRKKHNPEPILAS